MKQTQTSNNTAKKRKLIFGLGALVFIGAIAWGATMNVSYCMKKGGGAGGITPPNRPGWATAVTPKFDVHMTTEEHDDGELGAIVDKTYDIVFTFYNAPGNTGDWLLPALGNWTLDAVPGTGVLNTITGKTAGNVEGKLQTVLDNEDSTAFSNWVLGSIFDPAAPIGSFLEEYGSSQNLVLDRDTNSITYTCQRSADDSLIQSIDKAGGVWIEVGLDLAKIEGDKYQFNSTYNLSSTVAFDVSLADDDDGGDDEDDKSIAGSLLGSLLGPLGSLIPKTAAVGDNDDGGDDTAIQVRIELNPGTYQVSASNFGYNFDLLSIYNTNPSIRWFESQLDGNTSGSVSIGESALLKFAITGQDYYDAGLGGAPSHKSDLWYNPFSTEYDENPLVKYGSLTGTSNFGESDFLGVKYIGEKFYFEPILSNDSAAGVKIYISDDDGTFEEDQTPDYNVSGGSGVYFGDQENHKSVIGGLDTALGLYVNTEISMLTGLVASGVNLQGFYGDESAHQTTLAIAYDEITGDDGNTGQAATVDDFDADKLYRDYLAKVHNNVGGTTPELVKDYADELAKLTSDSSEMDTPSAAWLAESVEWRAKMIKLATDRDNRYSATSSHIEASAGLGAENSIVDLDRNYKTRFIAADPSLQFDDTTGAITDDRQSAAGSDYTSLIKFAPKSYGWPENKISSRNFFDNYQLATDGFDGDDDKGVDELGVSPSNIATCATTINDIDLSSPVTEPQYNYGININDYKLGNATYKQYGGTGNSYYMLRTQGQIGAYAAPILQINPDTLGATINFPLAASVSSLVKGNHSANSDSQYDNKDDPWYAYTNVNENGIKWVTNQEHYWNEFTTHVDLALLSNYGVKLNEYVELTTEHSDKKQVDFQAKHISFDAAAGMVKETTNTYQWKYIITDFWKPTSWLNP